MSNKYKTEKRTNKLPKLAAITMLHLEIKYVARIPPNNPEPKITIATPKLAPELIPSTNGPANGFLNNVCISKPEIPSPEPTKTAVIALGNLKFVMITCQVSLSVVLNRPSRMAEMGI